MKVKRLLSGIPTGEPQPGGSMVVTRVEDGVLVGSATTDSDGFASLTANGSPGPIKTVFLKGQRWQDDSRSIMPIGSMEMCELRDLIKFLHNDGVIIGYGATFAATTSGTSITVQSGAAVLDGVLSVHYDPTIVSMSSGDRALVIKQMHANGRTATVDIPYADIGSTTCVPLWRCTVTGGSITSKTWIGTPTLQGIIQRHPTVMRVNRLASGSTTNASGEYSGLLADITLENGVTYDITVKASVITRARHGAIAIDIGGSSLSAYQSNGDDITVKLSNSHSRGGVVGSGAAYAIAMYDKSETALTDWVLQGTFGSFGSGTAPNFNTPGQVAVDSSGNVYVADTGNARLVKLNSSGAYVASITGLTSAAGVCVDSSDNIYVTYLDAGVTRAYKKYNASLVLQRTEVLAAATYAGHCATDGTTLWIVQANIDRVRGYSAASGGLTGGLGVGGTGSGNGQFNGPWGVCYANGEVYVVDAGNTRVQVFTTTGTYQRQWAINSGARGIIDDDSGDLWVAEYSSNQLRRFSNTGTAQVTISQATPEGIARASGDVLWVSNVGSHSVSKFDETASAFTWDSAVLFAMAVPRT